MTRRTKWRPKPITLRDSRAALAFQAPPSPGCYGFRGYGELCEVCGGTVESHGPTPGQLLHEELRREERESLERLKAPRGTAPTEQEEHRNLAAWIRLQWWAKGARRLESQASRGVREQAQLAAEGGEFLSGNPDWMVFVPLSSRRHADGRLRNTGPAVYALEIKRRDVGKTRPRDREWWLTDVWDWQRNGEVENPKGERYGLRWSQACALRSMNAAGVRTYVAYGWDDAARWLEEQIGPRPAVGPDWGW